MKYWRHIVSSCCLLGAGTLVGGAVSSTRPAWGESRTPSTPPAFQSGGQLSVPILRDIAGTLEQIDERLARLEALAKQMRLSGQIRPAAD